MASLDRFVWRCYAYLLHRKNQIFTLSFLPEFFFPILLLNMYLFFFNTCNIVSVFNQTVSDFFSLENAVFCPLNQYINACFAIFIFLSNMAVWLFFFFLMFFSSFLFLYNFYHFLYFWHCNSVLFLYGYLNSQFPSIHLTLDVIPLTSQFSKVFLTSVFSKNFDSGFLHKT